tara:strand:- start:666 stop:1253 length:588 start_codon:yes stop_codon:yes gene_type:complete
MQRWDILNALIKNFEYTNYLEIGVQDYYSCCSKVKLTEENKTTIDPSPRNKCDFIGTSNEYFTQLDSKVKFDLIFIDGLHHSDQVLKDIKNSLKHLNDGGSILCHDCLPLTEKHQEREDHGGEWNGDVWKAIAQLRIEETNLSIKTIDTDWGCCLIQRGNNTPYIPRNEKYLTWEYFNTYKNELMNVVSPFEVFT